MEERKQEVQEVHELGVLALAAPGQLDADVPVVLEVGLVSIDDNRVFHVAADPPQQFQEPVVLLNGNKSTYLQWYR